MTTWLKVEDIKPFPLAPVDEIYTGAALKIKDLLGIPIPGFAFHYREFCIEFLIAKDDRAELGRRILSRIRDRAFTDMIVREGLVACDELLEVAEPFLRSANFSENELASRYEKYLQILGRSMGYGYLANLLDYASDEVDNILVEKLERNVYSKVPDRKTAIGILVALTTPDGVTFPNQEHLEFLKLALVVMKDKNALEMLLLEKPENLPSLFELDHPALAKKIKSHQEKWAWLSFLFVGPASWDLSYFYSMLSNLAKNNEGPKSELERLEKQPARLLSARKKASKLVSDDAYFYAARQLSYLKAMRKDAQVHSYFYLDGFFRNVAKRFGLSPTQARFHSSGELLAILRGQAEPDAARANRRFKECVFYTYRGKKEVLEGPSVSEFLKDVRRPQVVAADEIRGSCACPGTAKGTVKVVNTVEEAGKVQQGDILVSYATNPELISAMRKSSAIVTDMGGLTCHAAIVSRELNIPCVIGTKMATRSFKDGDLVEVNATEGWVRKA